MSRALLRTIVFLAVIASPNTAWCQDSQLQEVHNLNFNFHGNCSMTINWTTPEYQHKVSRYIVESAVDCPDTWKSHPPVDASVHSMVIEDLALITSCLLGRCYIQVVAELALPSSGQTMRKSSHCVRINSSFYDSSETKRHAHSNGQPLCLPIRAGCPWPTLPTFYIGEQMIVLLGTEDIDDDYYLGGGNFCISNNSNTNLVVHEVCHFDTTCSNLCDEDKGELVLMTRTDVQPITLGMNLNDSKIVTIYKSFLDNGSNDMPLQPEMDSVPSIVKFCSTDYTNAKRVNICLCLPLHELHGPNSDDIMVEIESDSVPGTLTMNLNPNIRSQCFDVEVPVRDIQCMLNSTSFEICLMLLGSTDAARCIHTPEPCVNITISNNTCGITTRQTSIDGGIIAVIVIVAVVIGAGVLVNIISAYLISRSSRVKTF